MVVDAVVVVVELEGIAAVIGGMECVNGEIFHIEGYEQKLKVIQV